MLRALQAPGQHLIVSDFNLHHPVWGGLRVLQAHAAVDILLEGMLEHKLELLLPLGTITCEKKNKRSTLDLVLGTEDLASRVIACQVTDAFSGSDHLPIETTIQLETAIQKDLPTHQCFKRTKLEAVQASAHLLQQPNH